MMVENQVSHNPGATFKPAPLRLMEATTAIIRAQINWLDTLGKCIESGELVWDELPPETQRGIRAMMLALRGLDNLPPEWRGAVEN
jgi:hypothetical protein